MSAEMFQPRRKRPNVLDILSQRNCSIVSVVDKCFRDDVSFDFFLVFYFILVIFVAGWRLFPSRLNLSVFVELSVDFVMMYLFDFFLVF